MIIDASIGVKWLVPEDDAQAAADLLERPILRVPMLFFSEVGNALTKKARRGEIVLDEVARTFAELPRLVTIRDEQSAMPRALEMAGVLSHSFYDCVYLALAEVEGTSMVTADIKFARKVAKSDWASLVVTL